MNLLLNLFEELLDQSLITGKTDFQRIFQHQRQQQRRGLTTVDRPLKTCSQQVGDTAYMVDMDMGHHQRIDLVNRELDL